MAEKCRPDPNSRHKLILNHPLGELADLPVTGTALGRAVGRGHCTVCSWSQLASHFWKHFLNFSAIQKHYFYLFLSLFGWADEPRNSTVKAILWPLLHNISTTTHIVLRIKNIYRERQYTLKQWLKSAVQNEKSKCIPLAFLTSFLHTSVLQYKSHG